MEEESEEQGRGRKGALKSMLESLISTATSPQHSCTKRSSLLDQLSPSYPLFSDSPIRKQKPERVFSSSKHFLSPSDRHLLPAKKSVMRLMVVAKYADRRGRQETHTGYGHLRPKKSPPAHPERLLRLSDLRGFQSRHRPTFSLS